MSDTITITVDEFAGQQAKDAAAAVMILLNELRGSDFSLLSEKLERGAYRDGTAQDIVDIMNAYVNGSKLLNKVTPTSVIPANGNVHTYVVQAGTYVNWVTDSEPNGIVVAANKFVILTRVDGVCGSSQMPFDFSPYIKTPTYNFGSQLPNTGSINADTTTYIFATAQKKSRVKSVSFYVLASGTLSIKRFTKSTDGLSLIYGGQVTVSHVAGLNTISPSDLFLEAGDYIGFHTTSKIKFISNGTGYSDTYYITPFENIQSNKNISSLNLLPNEYDIQISFNLEEYDIFGSLAATSKQNKDTLDSLIPEVSDIKNKLVGAIEDFNFGSNPVNNKASTAVKPATYVFSKDVSNSTLKTISWYDSLGGTFKLKVVKQDGDLFTFIEEISITSAIGLNNYTLPTPLAIDAGNRLGIFTTNMGFKFENTSTPAATWYFITSELTTSSSEFVFSDAQEISINFGLEKASNIINNIESRLNIIEPAITKLESDVSTLISANITSLVFGSEVIQNEALRAVKLYTYVFSENVENYTLEVVNFYSESSGSFKLKVVQQDGTLFTLVEEIVIPCTLGVNSYTLPTPLLINAGNRVAIYTASTIFRFKNTSTPAATWYFLESELTTSSSNFVFSDGQEINISFELVGSGEILVTRVETLESQVLELQSSTGVAVIGNDLINESFTVSSLPTTLENIGSAWTYANGRASTGSNGLANGLQSKVAINSNSKTIRADFYLSSADASIGIYNRPITFAQSGTIVKIDIVTNSITLYKNWNGSNTFPAVQQTKTISFTLAQGVPYRLSTKVLGKDLITSIINLKTGQSDGITITGGAVGLPISGYAFGKAGVFKVAGTISLDYFQEIINGTNEPRCVFYGNSITEGYLLASADVYSYRALVGLNNVGYISAQSSCKAIDVIERLNFELGIFKPKYIHILIGTNDTVQATWISNMETIHALLLSKGIIPLIGCIPANTSNTSQVTTWNAELLTKPYRFVRYDLATTVNNEGQTIDSSLFNADGVHPNAAGGLAMYNRMLLDVPELFND
jgi:hypothetical protein